MSLTIRDLPDAFYKSLAKNDKKRVKLYGACPKCKRAFTPTEYPVL